MTEIYKQTAALWYSSNISPKYHMLKSSYNYCAKNPMYNVDTTGNATIIIILGRLVMMLAMQKQ